MLGGASPVNQHAAPSNSLNEAALKLLTMRNPPDSHRTVESYLAKTLPYMGDFAPTGDTPLSPTKAVSPEHSTKRDREPFGSREGLENTALVLHDGLEQSTTAERKAKRTKKPSVVQAMKPRMSSNTAPSPATSLKKNQASSRADVNGRVLPDDSSPLLVARVDALSARDHRVPGSGMHRQDKVESHSRDAPRTELDRGKGKETAEAKRKPKAKRTDNVLSDEDEAEVEARLNARRERRRAKALIVKDRARSASKSGADAAKKFSKSSRKRTENEEPGRDAETSAAARRRSSKRDKGNQANKELQAQQRARNIQTGRLTLKPPVKMGLFKKGIASTRARVSTVLPDLAFSESAFFDQAQAPRRSAAQEPEASSHASKSQQTSSSTGPKQKKSARERQRTATDGVKRMRHQPKKDKIESSSSSSSESSLHHSKQRPKEADTEDRQFTYEIMSARQTRSKRLKGASIQAQGEQVTVEAKSGKVAGEASSSQHSAYSRKQRQLRSRQKQGASASAIDVSVQSDATPALDTSVFFKRPAAPANVPQVPLVPSSPRMAPMMEARPATRQQTVGVSRASPSSAQKAMSTDSIERMLRSCENGLVPESGADDNRLHSGESEPSDGRQVPDDILDRGYSARMDSGADRGQLSGNAFRQLASPCGKRPAYLSSDDAIRAHYVGVNDQQQRYFCAESVGHDENLLVAAGTHGCSSDPQFRHPAPSDDEVSSVHMEQRQPHNSQQYLELYHGERNRAPATRSQLGAGSFDANLSRTEFCGAGLQELGMDATEDDDDEAFRSAMRQHWYRTTC